MTVWVVLTNDWERIHGKISLLPWSFPCNSQVFAHAWRLDAILSWRIGPAHGTSRQDEKDLEIRLSKTIEQKDILLVKTDIIRGTLNLPTSRHICCPRRETFHPTTSQVFRLSILAANVLTEQSHLSISSWPQASFVNGKRLTRLQVTALLLPTRSSCTAYLETEKENIRAQDQHAEELSRQADRQLTRITVG